MSILDEFRLPSRWYTKIVLAIVALLFFIVVATSAIAGLLVYRIVKPQRSSREINMDSFPGRPETVKFSMPGAGEREGGFFTGLVGAPRSVPCHGSGSGPG